MRLVLVALLILVAFPAHADHARHRWGIGTTLSGADLSILERGPGRCAWLFDVRARSGPPEWTGSDPAEPRDDSHVGRDLSSFSVGPAIRYYLLGDADFSPYCDFYLSASTSWGRNASLSASSYSNALASTGVDVGLEYFTPWCVSVGTHSHFASLVWDGVHRESTGGLERVSRGHHEEPVIGFHPVLFVRAYFF